MSATTHPPRSDQAAAIQTAVTAAGLVGAVAFAGYMSPFFLYDQTVQEYTRSPLVVASGVVATLAFVTLAVTVPGLAAATRLPRWGLYLTAAGCAFVAAMAWAWVTMGAHVVGVLTDAQLDETSAWFELIWVPKVALGAAGLAVLAVVGWRRQALPRVTCVLLAVAAVASLLPAHPPGALLAGLALSLTARSATHG